MSPLAAVASSAPASAAPKKSLAQYLDRRGDQVVVIPDGTYRGAATNTARPATSGKYKGWLVLKAEHQNGVTVDLDHAELRLGPNASRILFVGMRFVKGSITIEGNNIAFWYTRHTFPAVVWAAQG